MSYELLIDTDSVVRVKGLKNDSTGEYVNDADVELTLLDSDDAEVSGQSWPLVLAYVTGSDGDYVGTVQDTIEVEDGDTGTARIDIDGDDLQKRIDLAVTFRLPTAQVLGWTSAQELYDMFGRTNVRTWADLENEEDDADIARRLQWAVDEATADARLRLTDSPVKLSTLTVAPRPLRRAATQLAGVLLYESRGVKDTASEDGTHRMSYHQKQADKFFRRVQAGQLRIGDGATTFPEVVTDASDDVSVSDLLAGQEDFV